MKTIQTPRGKRPIPEENQVNLLMELSYNGAKFQGYQSQPHANTVQDTLIEAWKILTQETDTNLFGCSRLDAGVHANHFVLNLHTSYLHNLWQKNCSGVNTVPCADILTPQDPKILAFCEKILRNLNGILKSAMHASISVQKIEIADPLFNARFDAIGKHYRYLIWYGFVQHALLTPRCWAIRSRIPPTQLANLFALFQGTHDFKAYRASDCSSVSTVRTIHHIHTWHHPRFNEMLVVDFWGEGFLKNMIRNICGSVVDCAIGKLTEQQIVQSFTEGTREQMGQCAPAHALTLEKVYYNFAEYENEGLRGQPFLLH